MRQALVVLLLFAAATRAEPNEVETKAIYAELKLPYRDGKAQQLSKEYHADGVAAADIAKNPDKYRYRRLILKGIGLLETARKIEPLAVLAQARHDRQVEAIRKHQEPLARLMLDLEDWLQDVQDLTKEDIQAEKSRRWQAHGTYVHAEIFLRIAILSEYNLALGEVYTDSLPPLREEQNGWKLTRVEKIQSPQRYREAFLRSRELFAEVVKDHPSTPWARLATSAQEITVGLQWVPARITAE